jgi:maleylpyruvate isomerase
MPSDRPSDRPGEREVALSLLPHASVGVVRAVDRLADDEWSTPSLLPGWSRAHVVAHLALNAEGLARCLRGVVAADADDQVDDQEGGEPRTMYESDEQRDQDIDDLAASAPNRIRDRLLAATTTFDHAVRAVPDHLWDARVERTPGGRTMRVGSLPGMRIRELEIHQVDLAAGYTTADWSPTFSTLLLDAMTKRLRPETRLTIRPLDVDRTWVVGPDTGDSGPIVTGPAADIGWWLTGRPPPDAVSCSRGELPSIEGW